MNAMEKMVASMLGITPEQMTEMLTGFKTLLTDLSGTLGTINEGVKANAETLARIEAKLDALQPAAPKAPKKGQPKDERGTGSGSGGDGPGSGNGAGGSADAGEWVSA